MLCLLDGNFKSQIHPMQDDPENGRSWFGKPLGNAHQNAECRESDKFANQRACRPVKSAATEAATERDPRLLEQGRRVEPGAGYAIGSSACSDRKVEVKGYRQHRFRRQVHARRHRAAGASRPCTRALSGPATQTHPEARVCRVRRQQIHAPGGDLSGASAVLASCQLFNQS
jgi:hypothetical protein